MELYQLGALHGMIVLSTLIFVAYTDHQAYRYFRGHIATLSPQFVKWSHRLVWLGLGLIVTTGAILLSDTFQYRLTQPAFFVKMSLVLMLIANAFVIGKLSHQATTTPFKELTKNEQLTLLISGGLSFTGWVGAALIGRLVL